MKKLLRQNQNRTGGDPRGTLTGQARAVYFAYIWHGFFLALTMSMLDLNTVFPALVSELTESKALFGLLYSIMLGAPLVFNLVFSHVLKTRPYKKNTSCSASTCARRLFSAWRCPPGSGA
ncbi:MAG: hypothetical protein PHN53_04930 [Eubacteriales bacterium]|nr:hypothetical protein [Eubacteriales bacterium]